MSKIIVIGAGFSGLSAACYMAANGHEVHVYEKNEQAGGRARQLKTEDGFVFDMGPSWYWMPDVFDNFFADFGYTTKDFYSLELLQPAFDILFKDNEVISIPQNFDELCSLFESIESGSAQKLRQFMEGASYKYKLGIEKLVYKPGLSFREFIDKDIIRGVLRLQVFNSFSDHVRKYFHHPKLIALMEFPILFLGAMPKDTPALYSLMNYAGLVLGTWYPQGGFGKVIEAFVEVAVKNGVQFHFNSTVDKINASGRNVKSIQVNDSTLNCDGIIASADYHHTESKLLETSHKNYTEEYWDKKTFAPSCLIFYLGIRKRLKNINHHTLFFDESLDEHAISIYKNKAWPENPLFYVCCPSKTDSTVAPEGYENLFILMPIASGLNDNEALREKYFQSMIQRLENKIGEELLPYLVYKKSYCINDFIKDYNAYKGNAYGLANTLLQTAILKPKIKNQRLDNLFYTGQLTVPGPGVPPSIISGKIAAGLLQDHLKSIQHEITI